MCSSLFVAGGCIRYLYSISTTTRLEVYNAVGLTREHVDGTGPRFPGIDAGAPLSSRARFIDFRDAWVTFPVIDNLRFESVVPGPGSLPLLGVGTLAVLACGAKSHRSKVDRRSRIPTLVRNRGLVWPYSTLTMDSADTHSAHEFLTYAEERPVFETPFSSGLHSPMRASDAPADATTSSRLDWCQIPPFDGTCS